MKKFLLLILFLCFMQTGCASMKYNYAPEVSNLDFPALNQETTVYLGEEMLIQGQQQELEVLDVKQPINGFCYNIPVSLFEKKGYDDSKNYFTYDGSNGIVTRSGLCDPVQGLYVDKKTSQLCVLTAYGGSTCYDGNFEIRKVSIANANSLQKTLLYSGYEGKKVNFMYVERSGFQTGLSHNISYDVSKDKIVSYRGAKIKIIDYSNESITYIVLQNFPER